MAKKRLMTGAEASERDANDREQAATREARTQTAEAHILSLDANWPIPLRQCPSPPPTADSDPEMDPDTPPRQRATMVTAAAANATTRRFCQALAEEEGEEEEEEEEEAARGDFIRPPSTAPAVMTGQ
jgi:hypothetical protein